MNIRKCTSLMAVCGLCWTFLLPPPAYAEPDHPSEHSHSPQDSSEAGVHPPQEAPLSLELKMGRGGSGTSWQPDLVPMFGHHYMTGDWMWMLHYHVLLGYNYRDIRQEFAPSNWLMWMATRPLAGGQFSLRNMWSWELILPETNPTPHRHPHIMELAVKYNHGITADLGFELYLAPAGEPALGPVAYPHRISAFSSPYAQIGRHKVSFLVLTGGLYTRHLKLEGSWFNGRSNKNVHFLDFSVPDSYSARFSYNPSSSLSFQASYGYFGNPERETPARSAQQVMVSGTQVLRLADGYLATTAGWSYNIPSAAPSAHLLLLESTLEMGDNILFGRAELAQRRIDNLVSNPPPGTEGTLFGVGTLGLGYMRNLVSFAGMVLGVGVEGYVNYVDTLNVFPGGGSIYVRLRPQVMYH